MIIVMYTLSNSLSHAFSLFCLPYKNKIENKNLNNVENYQWLIVLWTPSPLHCLLCLGSSLRDSDCALQCAQRPSPSAFYMLQLAFSQWPAVGTVPEFYCVHSVKQDAQESKMQYKYRPTILIDVITIEEQT